MLRSVSIPLVCLFVFTSFISSFFPTHVNEAHLNSSVIKYYNDSCSTVTEPENNLLPNTYSLAELGKKGLAENVFDLAVKGYNYLFKKKLISNKNIISIIDFSKSSSEKRLYVIDIKRNKLLYQTLVAHGRNSGLVKASSFSNEDDSHKSSLGFYVTLNTYTGDCGYSLKLEGCEKGFNDKAYERNIVMHGSEYVTADFLHSNGFLGRSWGCPAIPEKLSKKIINVIKKGSCLFIYSPDKNYLLTSPILNG